MADRRRRVNSDNESEEGSTESEGEGTCSATDPTSKEQPKKETEKDSEYESAEEEDDGENKNTTIASTTTTETDRSPEKNDDLKEEDIKCTEEIDTVVVPTELIDEEGGEECIAEHEEVREEFLNGDVLELSDDDAEDEDEEEDEECVEEERQQGDGEECSPPSTLAEKELDFDEDRRNPQYIPKKGTFYEHDDRNVEETPKEQEVDPRDKKKKKLWLDDGKWGHDRYREDEQIPKSRDELVEVYGYDIRCEDCPPRARRRRRYGRGPTKYERHWEDETAYGKERTFGMFNVAARRIPRGPRRGRGGGGRYRRSTSFHGAGRDFDFVPIPRNSQFNQEKDIDHIVNLNVMKTSKPDYSNKSSNATVTATTTNLYTGWDIDEKNIDEKSTDDMTTNGNPTPLPLKEPVTRLNSNDSTVSACTCNHKSTVVSNLPVEEDKTNDVAINSTVRSQTFENSRLTATKSVTESTIPSPVTKAPVRESYRGAFRRPPRTMGGRRGSSTGRYRSKNSYIVPNIGPRLLDKQVKMISSEIDRLTIDEKRDTCHMSDIGHMVSEQRKGFSTSKSNGHNSSGLVLSSKADDSSSRPKRYSSLRQRSLPEASTYQSPQSAIPPPHTPYYESGYQSSMYGSDPVTPSSQPQPSGSPPVISPPQYQSYTPSPYQENYSLRMSVNSPPRIFTQVTSVPTGQPLIAPPCIAPSPTLLTYPPPPPPPPAAYPPQFSYQQYPPPPPPPAPPVSQPPPDIYRSGITYYYPQNQPPSIRQVPLKRPKAAIPIVPPPPVAVELKSQEQHESDTHPDDASSATVRSESSPVQVQQATVEVES